jgi:hypothetical protein
MASMIPLVNEISNRISMSVRIPAHEHCMMPQACVKNSRSGIAIDDELPSR